MTATHDLAAKITTAVIDRIATDRLCNSANIGDAVGKELAVAKLSAQPTAAIVPAVMDEAKKIIRMLNDDPPLAMATPRKLLIAIENLYYELRRTGWTP